MNAATILQLPFVQIALPIVFSIWLGTLVQNKRIDDLRSEMNRRFDAIEGRLDRIERTQAEHGDRLARLAERTSPVRR